MMEIFHIFTLQLYRRRANPAIKNAWETMSDVPASTPLAEKISKDLKNLGFKFVGPTIIYAYMQSVGLVNDHMTSCFCYNREE